MSLSNLLEEPKVIATYGDRIREVISKMREQNQWVVPVLKEKILVGIISYNDLLKKRISPESKVVNLMSPPISVNLNDDIGRVIAKFYTTRSRAIPVIDERKRFTGIVTRERVLLQFLNEEEFKKAKVREVMNSPAITIDAEDSVARARWLMSNNNITKLPVIQGKEVAGIISARDILNRLYSISGKKKSSILTEEERLMAMPIKEIMNYPVITVNGAENLHSAVNTLLTRKISGMPVLEGNMIVGMFSGIDALKVIARKFELSMPIEAKLTGELKEGNSRAIIDSILERYLAKLERLTEILDFKVAFKEEAKSENNKKVYQVTARVSTKMGEFIAKERDWDPITALRKAVEKLEDRVIKTSRKMESKRRKPKAEEI
ncbi:histidine kinase [Sulfolobus acidocaldarius SUSAZ]|nr:histidine kinase [Sulfolobus acidocaldarius SUSAZ]